MDFWQHFAADPILKDNTLTDKLQYLLHAITMTHNGLSPVDFAYCTEWPASDYSYKGSAASILSRSTALKRSLLHHLFRF